MAVDIPTRHTHLPGAPCNSTGVKLAGFTRSFGRTCCGRCWGDSTRQGTCGSSMMTEAAEGCGLTPSPVGVVSLSWLWPRCTDLDGMAWALPCLRLRLLEYVKCTLLGTCHKTFRFLAGPVPWKKAKGPVTREYLWFLTSFFRCDILPSSSSSCCALCVSIKIVGFPPGGIY